MSKARYSLLFVQILQGKYLDNCGKKYRATVLDSKGKYGNGYLFNTPHNKEMKTVPKPTQTSTNNVIWYNGW